jgi:hypothetical protein
MNRISFAFVSTLVAACAAESSSNTPSPIRTGVAPGDPAPGVLSKTPTNPNDPGCLPSGSAMRQYGTTGEDAFRDVAITSDGDVLVTGYQNGILRPDGEVIGTRGTVLAYEGMFTPRAVIDTNGTDAVESLAIDSATGRVWLAVRTNGDLPELTAYGDFDVVLADLAGVGARTRTRGFDSTPEYPRQIAAGAGFVAIAGHEERLMLDGSTWLNPFAIVYDTSSEQPGPRWRLTRRTNSIELLTAVDVAGDTIAIAGAIATGAQQGAYIAARTGDADLLWQEQLSSTGGDAVAAVRIVEGGDVVFAGNDGGDVVVGRLDGATGTPRWSMRYGDERDERAADLAVDAHGRIYITGDLESSGGDHRDAFLLVVGADGEPLVDEFWTSDGDDVPSAIAIDACGTAVIAGETSGDLAGQANGGTDGFVIVTSTAAGASLLASTTSERR